MAKKIYNKNAREAHLMAEAYQRVHNESAESIEDRFASAVEYAGDVGEFNVQDFLEFKPYIANWDTLLEIIDEENTEGFSERWEEIKFGRSEDAERITDVFYKYVDKIEQDIYNGMDFKESMISNEIDPSHWKDLLDIYTEYMKDKTEGPFETGFEDGEGAGQMNDILGQLKTIALSDKDHETHKMLSMAEDLLGNLDDSGYGELAQRGISGVDDNYDDDAIDMLYNLIDQGWTKGSKAWKLSRKIVDFGLDGLASEDAEISGDGRSARDIPPDVAGKIAKQQADDASDAAAEEQRQRRLHAPSPADKFGRE